jgi:toxin ParE1/3/4
VYLAEEAGVDTAERFLTRAAESFNDLAGSPEIGSPLATRRPGTRRIEEVACEGLPNFLIFYQARTDGVSIVRIIHGTQDWWQLFDVAAE